MKNLQKGSITPILLIVALLIVGGGTYFYLNKETITTDEKQIITASNDSESFKTEPNESLVKQNSKIVTSTTSITSETVKTKFSGTISDVLKKDGNNECTFSVSMANQYDGNNIYTYSGNIFIFNEKFLVNRNASSASQSMKTESHSLFDGTYLYSWSSSGLQLKMDVNKYLPWTTRKIGGENLLDSIDLTRIYSFECKSFDDGGKTFLPPSTVKFTELSR